jgi:glycosyltransferase involved in cell wall biosynthesis
VIPILVLAYHFPPIGGGGVQRNAKFVRYLPSFGYAPTVVTGQGQSPGRWTPGDETLLAEIPAEVEVLRVPGPEPPPTTGWRGAVERRLMLRSPLTRWWQDGAVATATGAARSAQVQLLYASLVPYETAEAAVRIASALGIPWVADLQDPWALDEMWLYPTALHRRRDRSRMRSVLRTAAAVVMNTPEAALRLRNAFPELADKLVVSIPNGFDEQDFRTPAAEREHGSFRIVHTGYLHTVDGLRLRRTRWARRLLGGTLGPIDVLTRSHVFLLEAIESIIEREPELASKLELVLAGVVSEADREVAAGYEFVRMPGYLTHEQTVALVRSAELLFLPMHDLPPGTRAGLVPGKAYEYLASGRPILGALPDGDARDLLAEAGGAFLCRPADTEEMARIVGEQIERWRAGIPPPPRRQDVLARYERRYLTQLLAETFAEVLAGMPTPPLRLPISASRSARRAASVRLFGL